MKKYLSMLAVVAVAASAFAQGTVNFSNNGSTLVKLPDGTSVPANGGFVQLLWAPANTAATDLGANQNLTQWLTANPGWAKIDTSVKAIGPVAGRFLGGTVTVPTSTPGAPINAAVASWAGSAANFDAAVAAGSAVGISAEFAVTTGNPNTTPAGTPAVITGVGQFGGMTLGTSVIPEPSSLALAGLGAAALLVFRRRK
jgi:hypothetical protein